MSATALAIAIMALAPNAWAGTYFDLDAGASARPTVVGAEDMIRACSGISALRSAAMTCPLDHQLVLRGLPDLVEACAQSSGGRSLPTREFPVPHPSTVAAAVVEAEHLEARVAPGCRWQLEASRIGQNLTVTAPEASGVVELRVGWRADANDVIHWLQPAYERPPPVPGMLSTTVEMVRLPVNGGYIEVDLVAEMIDADDGTTRVILAVAMPDSQPEQAAVSLGPALEVSVGSHGRTVPIGGGTITEEAPELPTQVVPPAPDQSGLNTVVMELLNDQPGEVGRVVARLGKLCAFNAAGIHAGSLAPETCGTLRTAEGKRRFLPPDSGPLISAAARADLEALARTLGEELLLAERRLPPENRSWARTDGALVLAALGATIEAVLDGHHPLDALAVWARQRPPVLPEPDGTTRRFGFYGDAQIEAAPVASALYLASLTAALAPPIAVGLTTEDGSFQPTLPPEGFSPGATALAAASTLSWSQNLPGGTTVSWTGLQRPIVGTADLGWLDKLGRRLSELSRAGAADLAKLHDVRSPPGAEGAAAAVRSARASGIQIILSEVFNRVQAAVSILPEGETADPGIKRARQLDLAAAISRTGEIMESVSTGDEETAAIRVVQLAESVQTLDLTEPTGAKALDVGSVLAAIGGVSDQASSQLLDRGGLPDGVAAKRTPGLHVGAGVGVGLGVGMETLSEPPEDGGRTAPVLWPAAQVAAEVSYGFRDTSAVGARLTLFDLGAPLAWRTEDAEGQVQPSDRPWMLLFSPGAQLTFAVPGVPVVVCPGMALAPRARTVDVAGDPGSPVNGLRFGLSILLDTAWYLGS